MWNNILYIALGYIIAKIIQRIEDNIMLMYFEEELNQMMVTKDEEEDN